LVAAVVRVVEEVGAQQRRVDRKGPAADGGRDAVGLDRLDLVLMRTMRNSPPTLKKWLPRKMLTESMSERE